MDETSVARAAINPPASSGLFCRDEYCVLRIVRLVYSDGVT